MSEIKPHFHPTPNNTTPESEGIQSIITTLHLQPHVEGGYFVETDRDPLLIPSPFPETPASSASAGLLLPTPRPEFNPKLRNASTTIYYLITPNSPQGNFHRNRARTIHTLHKGRGRYVLIHEDSSIEVFTVGHNIAAGEKLQWIVEGGKYKASYLLPDTPSGTESSEGLLISETVVPGFEFVDHDFLNKEGLNRLVGEAKAHDLEWLVREEPFQLDI
ncbi:RmlC-like cupin domain-containing protein [Diplogelasinospora grovesii]|uniref:RmlC-like cupin domain-containing protein n=1 Tax=Diplogelasinospora grovesii TaxID=303347 RepID=A0AAN6SAL5_9PEZI|nr:RmlC-like cupin domain-containing protein [Diplogelasinospora grovesii]